MFSEASAETKGDAYTRPSMATTLLPAGRVSVSLETECDDSGNQYWYVTLRSGGAELTVYRDARKEAAAGVAEKIDLALDSDASTHHATSREHDASASFQ